MGMSWIYVGMLLLSLAAAGCCGQLSGLSAAALEGAQSAIRLAISIGGPICLWSGVCETMQKSGLAEGLSRLCAPLLRRLFPRTFQDPEAAGFLSGNVIANLLGLGNAATPLGLRAVRRVAAGETTASDELCRFVVLNTASLQLLPTTAAAIRMGLGASNPFDILPAVWLSSALALTMGLLTARLLQTLWTA